MSLRYVTLTPYSTVAEIDAALLSLGARRKATSFALVRDWIDAEIDVVLDMRSLAALEALA